MPKSSYYYGPPPSDSAYGTPPIGQIGVHHPREILRIERDYTGGEIIQFAPIYPLELENRVSWCRTVGLLFADFLGGLAWALVDPNTVSRVDKRRERDSNLSSQHEACVCGQPGHGRHPATFEVVHVYPLSEGSFEILGFAESL